MREFKNLMRDNRISGTPVVEDGQLVGIVSIEDLILAMEKRELDAPVSHYMTAQPHTVDQQDSVGSGPEEIRPDPGRPAAGAGRAGRVGGHHHSRRHHAWGAEGACRRLTTKRRVRRYRASHIFEDIASDKTSLVLRYNVAAA